MSGVVSNSASNVCYLAINNVLLNFRNSGVMLHALKRPGMYRFISSEDNRFMNQDCLCSECSLGSANILQRAEKWDFLL